MELRKKNFPELLFIMETMHSRNILVDIQEWLGYDRVFTVNHVGTCGGLALFWKKSTVVEIKFVDKNLMDFHVQLWESSFFCFLCL